MLRDLRCLCMTFRQICSGNTRDRISPDTAAKMLYWCTVLPFVGRNDLLSCHKLEVLSLNDRYLY